jgi:hypothetical protein
MTYQIVLIPALKMENLALTKGFAIERREVSASTLWEALRHRPIDVCLLVVVVVFLEEALIVAAHGYCHDFNTWVHELAWETCEVIVIVVPEVLKQFWIVLNLRTFMRHGTFCFVAAKSSKISLMLWPLWRCLPRYQVTFVRPSFRSHGWRSAGSRPF